MHSAGREKKLLVREEKFRQLYRLKIAKSTKFTRPERETRVSSQELSFFYTGQPDRFPALFYIKMPLFVIIDFRRNGCVWGVGDGGRPWRYIRIRREKRRGTQP